jgi:hypothetical protein
MEQKQTLLTEIDKETGIMEFCSEKDKIKKEPNCAHKHFSHLL